MEAITRKGDEVKINLFPKQHEFITSECDDVLMGGAVGSGKSKAVIYGAMKRRIENPGTHGIIFRRTFPELEKSIILGTRDVYPLVGATYNAAKHEWKFPNGSIQSFGYCEKDGDVYRQLCFHPATEILTRNGWKLVSDIVVGEEVATMNPATRFMEYAPTTKTWAYDYDGDMISLWQKDGVSFSVTPNHTMWASTEKVSSLRPYPAEKLPLVARIPQRIKWRGSHPRKKFKFSSDGHNGRDVVFTSKQWMSFLGWYLSEGCVDPPRWAIRISQTKKLGRDKIESLLGSCDLNFHIGSREFSFNNKALVSYLLQFGDCFSKFVPRDVMEYDKKHLQLLLDALLGGDGTWRDKDHGVFTTSSNRLKDDVSEIALKCGYRVTENLLPPLQSGFGANSITRMWHLGIFRKHRDTSIRTKDGHPLREPYVGKVFCVTVEPYHTVLIRHGGRISWSGQSAEYHDMWFDEATTFTEFQFKYLTSRCRSSIPGVKTLVRLTSNPGGPGHVWVYNRYIKPGRIQKIWKDEVTGKTLSFIPATLHDNPALLENDPDYLRRLRELPEKKYKALAEGNWDVFEGTYFENFDPRAGHGVLWTIRKPESYTLKFLGIDWGFSDPACVLWCELTPMGRVYIYRELYTTRRSPKELAQDILDLSPEEEEYMYAAVSPEIFGKRVETEGGGQPIADLMQEVLKNRIILKKANNARVPGWLKIREFLFRAPDGLPWVQISPNCTNLIRTLPALIHDSRKVEDVDGNSEDH